MTVTKIILSEQGNLKKIRDLPHRSLVKMTEEASEKEVEYPPIGARMPDQFLFVS